MITDKTECNNPLFGRILTAMVTPFTENGDVDYELAIKLSNYLFENGSDGIVLCGTTGESPTLSWAEQHDLFIAVKGSLDAKDAKNELNNVCGSSLWESLGFVFFDQLEDSEKIAKANFYYGQLQIINEIKFSI